MSKLKQGILITFEGTEGSGKSTLIRNFSTLLTRMGQAVTVTREPGGNALSEKIRALLLETEMCPWTELFLYQAARCEHLAKTIRPALERGEWVLCDRFTDSTLAYQAHARKLPWKTVKTLNQIATQGIKPNLTVLLDMDPEAGLRRAQNPNRFEAEGIEFQKKVRSGFLKARSENPKKWFRLQVQNKTPEQLSEIVLKQVLKRFKTKLKGL